MDGEYHQFIDEAIVNSLVHLRREHRIEKVFPKDVAGWLPFPRHEATLRRDFQRLAQKGLIERIGGSNSRRGYTLRTMRH